MRVLRGRMLGGGRPRKHETAQDVFERAQSALMLAFQLAGVSFGNTYLNEMSAPQIRFALWRLHDLHFADGERERSMDDLFAYEALSDVERARDRQRRLALCREAWRKNTIADSITDEYIGDTGVEIEDLPSSRQSGRV